MDAVTKTWVSLGLVVIAVFEFYTAMSIFGVKGGAGPRTKIYMRLHRIMGYVFAIYFVWISWVCVDLMERLYAAGGYNLDARGFGHGALAVLLLVILAFKVSVVRIYQKYRPYVQLLGLMVALGTVVLWAIAGWMFLIALAPGTAGY